MPDIAGGIPPRWRSFASGLPLRLAFGAPPTPPAGSASAPLLPSMARFVYARHSTGLLVAQDDPAALVAGLNRLLGDEALRERLASRGVEVRTRFSPERIRGMWRGLFDELLEQRRQGMGGA